MVTRWPRGEQEKQKKDGLVVEAKRDRQAIRLLICGRSRIDMLILDLR